MMIRVESKNALIEPNESEDSYSSGKIKHWIITFIRRFGEILECPVCFNKMDVSLKLCVNGHGTCSNCRRNVNKCPTCRGEFVEMSGNKFLSLAIDQVSDFFLSSGHTCTLNEPDCLTDPGLISMWEYEFGRLVFGLHTIFKCPGCNVKMDKNLVLCTDGHAECRECASKNETQTCLTCKKNLLFKFHQNTLLAKIIESEPKLCPNAVVQDKHKEDYNCEYLPTQCLVAHCDWKGFVKNLLKHVKKCHPFGKGECLNVKQRGCYSFNLDESKAFYTPIIFQDQVFWKYFHRDGTTKIITHKLYLPTSKPPCKYYLNITFEEGDIKFEQSCEAIHGEDCYNAIYKKLVKRDMDVQRGLVIPDHVINAFSVPGIRKTYYYYMKLIIEDIA